MNTKLFSEAISEVSDKYYEEAANYHCKWVDKMECYGSMPCRCAFYCFFDSS